MAWEVITPLPPGRPGHTLLVRHGARLAVAREVRPGTDCSYPDAFPHLVTLQEAAEVQGRRHAFFEWVPGVTLLETITALKAMNAPVPLGLTGRVVLDAARALADVKPLRAHGGLSDASLLIGFDGEVHVLDWGAPRVSRFRPPGRANFAADVFALGAVLHSVLTGFTEDYVSLQEPPMRPSTVHAQATRALDEVVLRALSPQADLRPHDVGVFADELEPVLGELFPSDALAGLIAELFAERLAHFERLGVPTGGAMAHTMPRAVVTKPSQVPWDSGVFSEPSAITVKGSVDDDEEDEPTTAVSRAEVLAAQGTADTARRIDPQQLIGTTPKTPSPLVNTRQERAHRGPADTAETTPPRGGRAENTTEEERARAKGQERINTPPLDIAAAIDEELDDRDEPTTLRPRRRPAGEQSSEQPAARPSRLRYVVLALAVVVAGLAVAMAVKLQRLEQQPAPVDPPPLLLAEDEADAGEDEEEDEPEALLADAGEFSEVDAGAVEELDAGAPVLEADAGEDEPVKQSKKKKKKKKKRRRQR